MDNIRTVKKVIKGENAVDGAGVKLVRVFGHSDTKDFDPFLMLDAFDSSNPQDYINGFPWHPHRGIETITYLISGDIEHADSLGNKGSILDGECQWMTAGSGIIHQEMPKPSKRMLGVQLWLNLPSKDKMVVPKYRGITKNDIPVIDEGNIKIHIVAGTYKREQGVIKGDYTEILYLDVELEAGSDWSLNTQIDDTLFIYVISGEGYFDESEIPISEKNAILFNKGGILSAKTLEKSARFLLLSGKPLNEPIAWGGPIVMNSKEELEQAFKDLENNTFIK